MLAAADAGDRIAAVHVDGSDMTSLCPVVLGLASGERRTPTPTQVRFEQGRAV